MELDYINELKKRAFGFYANEVVSDYEIDKNAKYILCKQRNRLCFNGGFIALGVNKQFKFSNNFANYIKFKNLKQIKKF